MRALYGWRVARAELRRSVDQMNDMATTGSRDLGGGVTVRSSARIIARARYRQRAKSLAAIALSREALKPKAGS
jgi:hypothetical protein